jgi:2-oxoglutarate dehydrogenase E1 component
LNVLANIFGKSTQDIFVSLMVKIDKEYFDGDVKYHLGLTADKIQSKKKININLAPNPSHLDSRSGD